MRNLATLMLLIGGCASLPDQQLSFSAREYRQYGRLDDVARAAPTMCDVPVNRPRVSASRDEATHGRKLYYLFAKDRSAYLHARDFDQPDGQVVVKESWLRDEAGAKGPLFMMMKERGEWTYATASPDGATIAASGKLASCIECHESASTRDRMFGVTTRR
ncbi:MAG TPA: hypothetical protein VE981_04800 [Planctomycetota bacterium]|nr:hypothetical protein [Planctomycetota bacterium]